MKKQLGIVLVVIFVCNLLPMLASAKKSGGGSILGFDPGNCKEVTAEDGAIFTVCVTNTSPNTELTRETFYQLQRAVKSLALNAKGKGVKKMNAESSSANFRCNDGSLPMPPLMPEPVSTTMPACPADDCYCLAMSGLVLPESCATVAVPNLPMPTTMPATQTTECMPGDCYCYQATGQTLPATCI